MSITLGSLFDGSGGFPLAGSLCGIVPLWASEIEPYPIAVTKSRFPDMKHLGDISQINGAEIDPVDIITFGSPCQDLSIAGKRAGLKHESNGDNETTRSGLFMEAIRIIREMRCATNGQYPRFALWENVPGAFSSNKGEDFRIVLEEIIKISEEKATVPAAPKGGWPYSDAYMGDRWSLAYRTFDAQYWGVPQRRRRIYLIADFTGGCAPRILFEREGLRGNFKTSQKPWERITTNVKRGSGADDFKWETINSSGIDGYNGCLTGDKSSTIGVNCGISTGRNGVMIFPDTGQFLFHSIPLSNIASTLRAGAGAPKHNQDYIGRLILEPYSSYIGINGDIAGTIDSSYYKGCGMRQGIEREVVCAPASFYPQKKAESQCFRQDGVCNTLINGTNPGFHNGLVTAKRILSEYEISNYYLTVYSFDSLGSNSMKSKYPFSGCRIVDVAKTLDTSTPDPSKNQGGIAIVQSLILFEPRSQDGVPRIYKEISPTLNTAQGGQRQPCVVLPVYCIQGNCIDRADNAGCNGKGWREHASFTLNTIDRPGVIYTIDQGGGKSGANYHFDISPTLACTHGGEPVIAHLGSGKQAFGTLMANASKKQWLSNQEALSGDYHIIEEYPKLYRQCSFAQYISGLGGTLKSCGGDCGGGSENLIVENLPFADEIRKFVIENNATALHQQDLLQMDNEVSRTLAAGTHASGSHLTKTVINTGTNYIVRRLTPIECARLQGFPDDWGKPDYKTKFTDEEYIFWLNVRNTFAKINEKNIKEYTKEQMIKWYNKLHSDSAEYKMWGNGVALPPTLYCMQGIYDAITDYKT